MDRKRQKSKQIGALMRTVSRLSVQRRIFELTKAQKEELQQELNEQAIAKQEKSLEKVEVVYGRQSGKRG